MTHHQAYELALELMRQHGLIQSGWRFRWSHGKRQLGVCRLKKRHDPVSGRHFEIKTIGLSKYLVALNSDDEVRDTILHEIAHALAGVDNGHNRVWKEACLRIGARPRRLAGEGVKIVEAPFAIICGSCNRHLGKRHRRVAPRRLLRSYCRSCGPKSQGLLKLVRNQSNPTGV